jgi:hypothetical protein
MKQVAVLSRLQRKAFLSVPAGIPDEKKWKNGLALFQHIGYIRKVNEISRSAR